MAPLEVPGPQFENHCFKHFRSTANEEAFVCACERPSPPWALVHWLVVCIPAAQVSELWEIPSHGFKEAAYGVSTVQYPLQGEGKALKRGWLRQSTHTHRISNAALAWLKVIFQSHSQPFSCQSLCSYSMHVCSPTQSEMCVHSLCDVKEGCLLLCNSGKMYYTLVCRYCPSPSTCIHCSFKFQAVIIIIVSIFFAV